MSDLEPFGRPIRLVLHRARSGWIAAAAGTIAPSPRFDSEGLRLKVTGYCPSMSMDAGDPVLDLPRSLEAVTSQPNQVA